MPDHALLPLPVYEERYCAFVDIIGFKEMIGSLDRGTISVDALRLLLRIIHMPPTASGLPLLTGSDLRAQSISDAVCISTRRSGAGLSHLFYAIQQLTLRMLAQGFFVRGAVVKGKLYHDDGIVFGPALIRAYQLESEIVRYPRIMIASEVVSDIHAMKDSDVHGNELSNAVLQSDDGPRFLDVLADVYDNFVHEDDTSERLGFSEFLNKMADQIQRRYDESYDNPRHFEKVQWFARYWNRTVAKFGIKAVLRQASDGVSRVHV